MEDKMINIGFTNVVAAKRVVAIIQPGSAPIKRLKEEARERNQLIDASCGRRTRSVIIMDSNHVLLSAIHPETIANRFMEKSKKA